VSTFLNNCEKIWS